MSSVIGMYVLGAFVRFWLAISEYQKVIAERIEISTPLNSWKRVTEGLHLLNLNIHPYTGDMLHEPPLHLLAYNFLVAFSSKYLYLVFILCDIATAYLLCLAAKKYMLHLKNTQMENKERYAKDVSDILMDDKDFAIPPSYVAAAYLFNPYTVFNCVGFTTTVFANFFMALFLTGLMYGNLLISALALAICISQNLYPILLISPMFLQFLNVEKSLNKAISAIIGVAWFGLVLTYWSYYIYGNWNFLNDTYGFILTVPDLRPNTGLFWYFFIEMFEHFRSLFIYSFQINVTLLYFIPLSIRFRNDPMLLATSLLSLTATFKSYPCLGDVGFVLALLPCWKHLFNYIQQGFLVGCSFFVTTALAPTVWYLWIYSGSANANFYFGVTLAFATAQIFLITDILFAYIKREFTLIYGRVRKIEGLDAQLMLE